MGSSWVKHRRRLAGKSSADSAHATMIMHSVASDAAVCEPVAVVVLLAGLFALLLQPLLMQYVKAFAILEAAAVRSAAAGMDHSQIA